MRTSHLIRLPEPRAARQPANQSTSIETAGFPILLASDRVLSVRLVTPADAALLADLLAGLSDTTCRRRFFRPLPNSEAIWQEVLRVTQREPRLGVALVATAMEHDQVYAVALAELAHNPAAPTAAELGMLVRDDAQRQGVGTQLLRLLITLAQGRGVRTLRATLQADNKAARQLLRKLELAYHTEIRSGEITAWTELP